MDEVMSELSTVQRRTLFALSDACADIRALAIRRSEEADGVDEVEVDGEDMQSKLEALEREVGFAKSVRLPKHLMDKVKTQVLPPQYHNRFRPPIPTAA